MLEDNEIVEMYFMRDQQAIVRTDEKYGKLCRTISVRIVSDSRDAEECVEQHTSPKTAVAGGVPRKDRPQPFT